MSISQHSTSSISKRALYSKLRGDIFANYSVICQCRELGFPSEFINSVRIYKSKNIKDLNEIKPFCCTRHYFSSFLKPYLSIDKASASQLFFPKSDKSSFEYTSVDHRQLLLESKYFDTDFIKLFNPDLNDYNDHELADHFLKNSVNEPDKDPSPSFSVSQYYQLNPDVKSAQINALIHYLIYGQTEQRGSAPSNKIFDFFASLNDHIDILDYPNKCGDSIFDQCKVAICLHLHYPESLHDFIHYLAAFPLSVSLVITTTSYESKAFIVELLQRESLIDRLDLCYVYTENRGRDIGAFIAIYPELLKYDVVCKLHAKKSPHLGSFGENWFKYLVRSTIGNQYAVQNIVDTLFNSDDIGILAPTNFQGTNNYDWATNFEISQNISDQIFDSKLNIQKDFLRYPSATVFWFKPQALNHQKFKLIQPDFFPQEPIPIDGTNAHALERLIPYISSLNGFQTLYYFDPSIYLTHAKEWNIFECIDSFDDRDTFIIVGHDASNTGAPRTALALQRSIINDLNLNCIVILLNDGPLVQQYKDNGPTFVFTNNILHSYMNAVFKYSIRRLHVLTNTCISAEIGQLAQSYGHSHIALVHENADTGYWPSKMFSDALNADLCIFPGERVAKLALDLCKVKSRHNIAIRPQGIYRDSFPELPIDDCYSSVRVELGIPLDSKIVLGCGTIEPRKGFDLFCETAELLSDSTNYDIYFLWIGTFHPEGSEYKKWADRLIDHQSNLPNSNCIILGGCTKADRYFQACDVFYLPSRKDPFPGVVLEAMACKKPIIAFQGTTDVGNAFRDGCGGVLLSKFDTLAAAENILSYISNYQQAFDAGFHNESVIRKDYTFLSYSKFLLEKEKLYSSQKLRCVSYVSFILPTLDMSLLHLQQLLSCLESQSYSKWELCLAGDHPSEDVLSYLKYKMSTDERIKYHIVDSTRKDISSTLDDAMSVSSGKYIAVLGTADLLSSNCALELVYAHESKNSDFICTDPGVVDGSGLKYISPVIKHSSSEDTLLQSDYITKFASFSRELIQKISNFRSEYNSVYDRDLNKLASCHATNILHLPQVLCYKKSFSG